MLFPDVFAQGTAESGLTDLIATYGPFTPFAGLMLYLLRLLWEENKTKDAKIDKLTEAAMEEVIPLVIEATKILGDAVDALKQIQHGQPDVARMIDALESLEDEVSKLSQRLGAQEP